jgi:hypothetical protein
MTLVASHDQELRVLLLEAAHGGCVTVVSHPKFLIFPADT